MQKFLILLFTITIFFSSLQAEAVNKAQLEKEIKDLGFMLGYSLMCATERLGNDIKDPEQQEFIKKVFTKFIPLGPSGEKIFTQSIHKGLASMGLSNGQYCNQLIKTLIVKYESVGLTGDIFKPALDK
jgi:hypothetical protein